MANVLITGCAGFIGSSLAENILKNLSHFFVLGIDNLDNFYDKKNKIENVNRLKEYKRFKFYELDILNIHKLYSIEEKIDLCVHLAGRPGVLKSIENPNSYYENNLIGTSNILNFLNAKKSRKIIFASSSSIYKCENNKPFTENKTKLQPLSPYGFSKMFCENLLDNFHDNFGFDVVKLRLFSVYGPNMRPDLAIFKFTNLILNNKSVNIFGNGMSSRDYTYIDDIVNGIFKSINFILNEKNICETLNLGNSSPVQLLKLIEMLSMKIEKKVNVINLPSNKCELISTFADISKAKKLIDFKPNIDLNSGLDKFLEWHLK